MQITKDFASDFARQFELSPNSTAFLIVDMQYATASREMGLGATLSGQGKDKLAEYRFTRIESIVIPTIKRLLSFFRQNQLAVLYLTLGSARSDCNDILPFLKDFIQACNNKLGEMEHEILDEIKPQPGELVINKTTLGAFNSTNLDDILRSRALTDLVFAGVATNMCIETTARDAADKGFNCVLVEDACAASKPEYHEASLATFQRLFGRVLSSRQVIEELNSRIEHRE